MKNKIMSALLAVSLSVIAVVPSGSVFAEINTETDVQKYKKAIIDKSAEIVDYIADNGNAVYSPTSLNYALGMLMEGAKSDTQEELIKFYGPELQENLKTYLRCVESFNIGDKEEKSKLEIADAVWIDQNLGLKEEYKKAVEDGYQASVESLDFEDSEGSSKKINEWCNEKTEGLIPKIITPDSITPDTGLCLTNSIYFESAWNGDPWNVSEEKEVFGEDEETNYMVSSGDAYYENNQAIAFGRSYNNGLQFVGILPKVQGNFTLKDLDIYSLLKSTPEYDEVKCKMPKLNIETSASLTDILNEMGLDNIFSSDADFSGISDQPTHVGSILQKTKLELDENGTRAAAVTAIMVETMAMPPADPIVKEVDLNRPFAFLIYDSSNEEVLFLGKVVSLE